MEQARTLAELSDGATAEIRSIWLGGAMRRRLLELGLIPGTRVRCLLRAPSGSPIAFEVRGAMIALRRGDAAQIGIEAAPWG